MVRVAFSAVELGSSHFRWVLSLLKRHGECLFSGLSPCDCGPLRDHILPPWAIYAVSKVRKRIHTNTNIYKYNYEVFLFDVGGGRQPVKHHFWWPCPAGLMSPSLFDSDVQQLLYSLSYSMSSVGLLLTASLLAPFHLHHTLFSQIVPVADTHPLLVFVNPKSGGKQGERYPVLSAVRRCFLNMATVFLMAFVVSLQSAQEISVPTEPSPSVQPVKWRSCPWVRLPC